MSKTPPKFRKDRSLRFYNEVLGLDRLHYGLWSDDDPRTLEGVKVAQLRYENFLVEQITQYYPEPENTQLLDVGCGTGVMTETLVNKGYKAEGLSPDLHQQEVFTQRISAPFHLQRFQYFKPEGKKYHLILMSESAQYIPLPALFEVSRNLLHDDGILMVCDYFTFPYSSGPLAKSGHKLEKFMAVAHELGFELQKEQDITRQVAPTLESAKIFTDRYILPSIDIFTEKIRDKRPRLSKFVLWLFRKKIAKMKDNMVLIDAEQFCENKAYKLLIFKKPTNSL